MASDRERVRWEAIIPLSFTVMSAFGILFYGFSVYVTEGAAGSEFSKSVLSLGFGGATLVGGLLARPVGRFADRHGIRRIIGLGSVLGFVGMGAFGAANEPWQVVVAWWLLIGPAGAMTFYEPAFVAVNQWTTPQGRPKALAALTVVGGLAGVLFIPGTERLVVWLGWRSTSLVLGFVLLVVGGSTSLLAVPRHPQSGASEGQSTPLIDLLGDRRFRLYTVALMLSFLAAQGVLAHRVARFNESGFSVATVALWAAVASALSLPGRWLAPLVAHRWRPTSVQAATVLMVAAATALMIDGGGSWQMVGHFALFGLGFGALLPLRAMVMAEWFSGSEYGGVMGAQATAVGLAGASGPVIVGIMRDHGGGYRGAISLLAVVYVVAVVLIVLSGRRQSPTPPASQPSE